MLRELWGPRPRGSVPVRLWPVLVLLIAGLVLSGCSSFTVREATPTGKPPVRLAASRVEHALVVKGVNFDPTLGAGKGALLVIVENRGTARLRDVVVRATLLDGEGSELLAEQIELVRQVEGGEVRAVKFEPVPDLPLRNRYRLDVRVAAWPEGEEISHVRTFELQAGVNSTSITP